MKATLVAGLAVAAAGISAQTELDRIYERLAARADDQDVAWCHSMLPPGTVEDRELTAPPIAVRERFIGQVRAMGPAELEIERKRLSGVIALALEGRDVTGGYTVEELAFQRTLVDEALRLAETGGKIDPDNNSYRSYIRDHRDGAGAYRIGMADCLSRRVSLTDPVTPVSTPTPTPVRDAQPPRPRQAVVEIPRARPVSSRMPDSAGFRVPAATQAQIDGCRAGLPPDLLQSYRDADQVYLDRRNYVANVMRMDEEGLAAERQSLSRRLDLMANAPFEQDYSRPNTIADLSGRYLLVVEAQEKLFLADAIDVSLNPYNTLINAADRERVSIAQSIENKVFDCATVIVNTPIVYGAPAPAGSAAAWMTGTFDTGGGVMQLSPGGGTYQYQNGRIYGTTVNGAVMEGRWEQDLSAGKCADGRYWGRVRLTFTEDGFSGLFGYCDEEPHSPGGFQGRRRR